MEIPMPRQALLLIATFIVLSLVGCSGDSSSGSGGTDTEPDVGAIGGTWMFGPIGGVTTTIEVNEATGEITRIASFYKENDTSTRETVEWMDFYDRVDARFDGDTLTVNCYDASSTLMFSLTGNMAAKGNYIPVTVDVYPASDNQPFSTTALINLEAYVNNVSNTAPLAFFNLNHARTLPGAQQIPIDGSVEFADVYSQLPPAYTLVVGGTTFLEITSTNNSDDDTYLIIFDSNGNVLAEDDDSLGPNPSTDWGAKIKRSFDIGTYYIVAGACSSLEATRTTSINTAVPKPSSNN
jgi:hypothetical protein